MMLVSGKGGCGTSTVAANLAAAFVAHGERALLVDMNAGFRFLDGALGLADRTVADLADVLEGRCPPENAILHHRHSGVDLLAAPGSIGWLPQAAALEKLLGVCESFGYARVFFDCPAGWTPANEAVAACCTRALAVTSPALPGARGAAAVSARLSAAGLADQRLIIDRVGKEIPRCADLADLDAVIDTAGVQLIGVIPEQKTPTRLFLSEPAATQAVINTAARIAGKTVPLLPQFL